MGGLRRDDCLSQSSYGPPAHTTTRTPTKERQSLVGFWPKRSGRHATLATAWLDGASPAEQNLAGPWLYLGGQEARTPVHTWWPQNHGYLRGASDLADCLREPAPPG